MVFDNVADRFPTAFFQQDAELRTKQLGRRGYLTIHDDIWPFINTLLIIDKHNQKSNFKLLMTSLSLPKWSFMMFFIMILFRVMSLRVNTFLFISFDFMKLSKLSSVFGFIFGSRLSFVCFFNSLISSKCFLIASKSVSAMYFFVSSSPIVFEGPFFFDFVLLIFLRLGLYRCEISNFIFGLVSSSKGKDIRSLDLIFVICFYMDELSAIFFFCAYWPKSFMMEAISFTPILYSFLKRNSSFNSSTSSAFIWSPMLRKYKIFKLWERTISKSRNQMASLSPSSRNIS